MVPLSVLACTERLVIYCQTTSVSAARATHCATYLQVRAPVEQQPCALVVAVIRSEVERRRAIAVFAKHVPSLLNQQAHRIDVAAPHSGVQRRGMHLAAPLL